MRRRSTLLPIFAGPLVLALLSLIGLIGALLADGAWDWIGAGLLAAAPGVIVWARLRPGIAARQLRISPLRARTASRADHGRDGRRRPG